MVQPNLARRAFTLVELLVVIGIIAILIAILLPTISSANKQAKTTACAATLRSLGQALAGYANENKGYYPYGYYVANSPTATSGTTTAGDSDPNKNVYVWWSVLRGYMRGKGAPADNSTEANNGSTLTRFMEAFNCATGLNREAGCDFIANGAVMIQKNLEEGSTMAHPQNRSRNPRPQKLTGVYPDTILLWDGPELGNLVAPDEQYSRQYVISYTIDAAPNTEKAALTAFGLLGSPRKVSWRYRNVVNNNRTTDPKNFADGTPIYTGINEDVSDQNLNATAGGIRFRHGRNDRANFLQADGSVKTYGMTKKWDTASPQGELLRKYFRSKLPANYSTIDAPN